ncbi:protein phosphatase 2C-like protein, partial [Euroglyphus maynei]
MGSYLSKPITKVDSSFCENQNFVCCSASIQGWRKTQEDEHVEILEYDDKGTGFFAVFDGHGGDEVSKYCARKFPDFIKNSDFFKENKIPQALEHSFLKFDNTLKEPKVLAELKKIANIDDAIDIDEDETSVLRKEAHMPIEELLTKNFKINYANVGDSRCVLSREGKAVDMSEDHKPEDDKEKERIINAGGEITFDGRVNGGLNLSRAIGDHMYKNNTNLSDREQMITALPDIRTSQIDVEKDDFLFLACDGI